LEYKDIIINPDKEHCYILVPLEDATGAGPDITLILPTTRNKKIIFMSLKSSKKKGKEKYM